MWCPPSLEIRKAPFQGWQDPSPLNVLENISYLVEFPDQGLIE